MPQATTESRVQTTIVGGATRSCDDRRRVLRLPGGGSRMRQECLHRLNGYLAQRVPSIFLASSSRIYLNDAVLKCSLPWRARYPLS